MSYERGLSRKNFALPTAMNGSLQLAPTLIVLTTLCPTAGGQLSCCSPTLLEGFSAERAV